MSKRKKTPSGINVPGGSVTLYALQHPTQKSHQVRWRVPGIGVSSRTYAKKSEAEKKRDELLLLIANNEPFDTGTREPVSWSAELAISAAEAEKDVRREASLLEYAISHMKLRWNQLEPRSRGDLMGVFAEAVWAHSNNTEECPRPDRAASVAFVREVLAPMSAEQLTAVLTALKPEVHAAGVILQQASLPVEALAEPERIKHVVDVLETKVDGSPAARAFQRRRRNAFNNLLAQAVRDGVLARNPLGTLPPPKRSRALRQVNQREVVSLAAAQALLASCEASPNTRAWTAFLGCNTFAGMRPAEVGGLTWADLTLPADGGWGTAALGYTEQRPAKRTNAGQTRRRGPLKWREDDEVRHVLLMPRLVTLLLRHREEAPVDRRGPDHKVFLNAHKESINPNDASRALRVLREGVFADPASPHFVRADHPLRQLTPYGMRHHAATVWLAARVPASNVAEMLGHSYATLVAVYAGWIRTETERTTELVDAWYAEHGASDVPAANE